MAGLRLLAVASALASTRGTPAAPAPSPARLVNEAASLSSCVEGRQHLLEYETTGPPASAFVDLDSDDWIKRLSNVTCDIDQTKIDLKFNNRATALEWTTFFHYGGQHFIVGGSKWNCSLKTSPGGDDLPPEQRTNSQPGDEMILRRVMGWQSHTNGILGDTLTVATTLMRYDEVYESASIKFQTNGTCTTASKHLCLSWNSECSDLTEPFHAKNPIPFISKSFFNAACTNCFARLDTDVFVEIQISGWELQSLAAGFRKPSLHAGLVAHADSQKNWGSSFSKDLGVSPKTILKFKVGVVPFELGFDVPMQLDAEVDASESMHAALGATVAFELGDITVSWTQQSHWTHSTIEPVYHTTPQLDATSGGQATASVQIQPTFNLHFNRVFKFQAELKPSLDAEASMQNGDFCMEASYGMDVTTMAELDINIPFANIHKDWLWGPKKVFTSAGNPIPKKCVHVRSGNMSNWMP